MRVVHKELKSHAAGFYEREQEALSPFVSADVMSKLTAGGKAILVQAKPLTIGAHEPYIKATLRGYQCEGVNWLLKQYSLGVGGILGDEMGLGKTIQTISLLAWLAVNRNNWGPHLVIVPTSVMVNWEMELKRWCPAMKILTYFGSVKERKEKRRGWNTPDSFHVCITSYKLAVQDSHVFKRYFSQRGHPPFHRNGTYVEMGAADGVRISNTVFFERELGWSGLL